MYTPWEFSIVNSFVQALVYGIYVSTFAYCMRWLIYNDEGRQCREKLNVPMLITSVAVFLLQTAGLATSFQSMVDLNFIEASHQDYPLLNLINSAMEYTTFQIVDAVLIYRCWVVYAYSWRMICLPIFCWISSVVLSSYNIYLCSFPLRQTTNTSDALTKLDILSLNIWNGFYASNIAINIYATVAIVYQILRVMKNSVNNSSRLSQTLRIIAESGALYTLSTIVNLTASVLASKDERYGLFQSTADPINFSVAGTAFNLILIRVGQQRVASQGLSANSQFYDKGNRSFSAIRFYQTKETEISPSQGHSTVVSHIDSQDV